MKLGALKTTIRALTIPPKAVMDFGDGVHLELCLQKTPLLTELDAVFTGGKAQETGLFINPEGYITRESDRG